MKSGFTASKKDFSQHTGQSHLGSRRCDIVTTSLCIGQIKATTSSRAYPREFDSIAVRGWGGGGGGWGEWNLINRVFQGRGGGGNSQILEFVFILCTIVDLHRRNANITDDNINDNTIEEETKIISVETEI